MGKLGQGLLGRTSGKVGPVVGAKWKSLATVRARPKKPADAASGLQLDQRNKLSLLSTFFSVLMDLLEVSFRPLKKNMSAHNAAVSFNLNRPVFIDTEVRGLDYAKMVISRGSLFGASGVQARIAEEGMLLLSWNDDSAEWCDSTYEDRELDGLTVVLNYCDRDNRETFQYFENVAARVDLSVSQKLAKSVLQAPIVHCWVYFASADGKMVSQSQYYAIAGSTILPV